MSKPPKHILQFFRWFCRPEYVEDIEGDLLERYENANSSNGARKAKMNLWLEVLKLLRPGIIKPINIGPKLNQYSMFKHNFLISWRYLQRNKKYALLNLIGLTLGFTTCFILFQHISLYLTYDHHHEQADQIFEVSQSEVRGTQSKEEKKRTFFGMGPLAKDGYPEVEAMTRYITNIESLVIHEKENGEVVKFNANYIAEADPDFLQMFTLAFEEGDPINALSDPNTVVLTSSIAKRYFGNESPMGKTLQVTKPWGARYLLKITGVVEDMPHNSSFQFGMLKSLYKNTTETEEDWGYPGFRTYLLLKSADDAPALAEKVSGAINELPEIVAKERAFKVALTQLSENPLTTTRKLLLTVGLLILVITWVNYINLSAAKSLARAKQVGILKIHGSTRYQSIYQFTTEGLLIQVVAIALAAVMIVSFFPFFEALTQNQIQPLDQLSLTYFLPLLGLFLVGSFLSSALPSIALTRIKSMSLLKDANPVAGKDKVMANPLLILQFGISAILLIGFSLIYSQMDYLRNQNLGFSGGQTLIIKPSKDIWDGKMHRFNSFKKSLESLPHVSGHFSSTAIPGRGGNGITSTKMQGSTEELPITLIGVAGDYLTTMNIELLAGDYFPKGGVNFHKNRRSVVLNETAVQLLGYHSYDSIIGKKVISSRHEKPMEVMGVVEDHHFSDLKDKIGPLMMDFNPFRGFIFVQLDDKSYNQLHAAILEIEKLWNSSYTNQVFDYRFLDDEFQQQYAQEIVFSKIFSLFTGISILISCLGILGVSMFMAERKKKEVGIRKVLGAKVYQILEVFVRKMGMQVIIASVLALPLAYYLSMQWLQNFSYGVGLNVWMFLLPIAALFSIAIATVCLQTYRSATVNPIDSLKDE